MLSKRFNAIFPLLLLLSTGLLTYHATVHAEIADSLNRSVITNDSLPVPLRDADQVWPLVWPMVPTSSRKFASQPPTFIHPSCRPDVAICSGVRYAATVMAGGAPPEEPLVVKPIPIKARDLYDPKAPIAYSLFNGTPETFRHYFTIDRHTGELKQMRTIEKEDRSRRFYITVMAKPAYGSGAQSNFAVLTVDAVSPLDSRHDPAVLVSHFVGYVEETATIGSFVRSAVDPDSAVIRLTVTDPDLQSGMPPATYQYMLSGSGAALFAVDQQGYVYVNVLKLKLQEGQGNFYDLVVRAREVDTVPIRTSQPVTIRIHLIAVDRRPAPVFPSKAYYATAYAGLEQQSLIKLKAIARYGNGALPSLTYRIRSVSNDGQGLFHYNAETNTLLAVAPLSANVRYRVVLEAVDPFQRSATTVIMIKVVEASQVQSAGESVQPTLPTSRHVKSKRPTLPMTKWPATASFNISISEAVQPDTLVMTLLAENAPADMTFYRFVDGNEEQCFRIEAKDGRIFTSRPLDRERTPIYRLVIEVASYGVATYAEIVVTVSDVNDNAPVFSRNQTVRFAVQEMASAGSVVGRLTATDADSGRNGRVTYSIHPANRYFSIDPVNGTVRRTNVPFDQTSTQRLTVLASDQGTPSLRTSADVLIDVLSSARVHAHDEAMPTFLANYTVTIDENAVAGVLTQVKAVYPAGSRAAVVTYVLREGDRSLFSVDPVTGVLTTLTSLDAERQDRHTVVIGTEQNPSTEPPAQTYVTVAVQDFNDNAPVFQTAVYSITVSESMPAGSSVLQVSASDRDKTSPNGLVKYRLVGDEEAAQFFRVDESSGLITVARSLLGTGKFKFTLSVEARDLGTPSRSSVASVVVYVQSMTTVPYTQVQSTWHPPVALNTLLSFASQNFSTSVYEAIPPPHFVMTLPMRTASTIWQPVHCTIVSGNVGDAFQVKTGSGGLCEIETVEKLDRERVQTYDLEVSAHVQPLGGTNYTSTTMIHVEVMDQNDNRPQFQFDENNSLSEGTYFAVLDENAARLSTVLTVKASDQDAGKNNLITYSLVRADPDSVHFIVDRDTGELRNRRELAQMAKISSSFFYFRVQATDNPTFGTPLTSDAYVAVNVVSDLHRFVVSLQDWSPRHGDGNVRKLKKEIAEIGREKALRCRAVFLERVDNSAMVATTDVDSSTTTVDLVFVTVNEQTKRVCRTADVQALFRKDSVNRLKLAVQPSLKLVAVREALPLVPSIFGRRLQMSEIILIVVGCFILTICIIGIAVLCYYWSRSNKRRALSDKAMLYGVMPPFSPALICPNEKEYETQMLELAVPDEPYNRYYGHYITGEDGIYTISQVKPYATRSSSNSLSHVYIPPPDYGECGGGGVKRAPQLFGPRRANNRSSAL